METALRDVIEPIFEHSFAEQSYGFRPGRSAKQAVARVEELLNEGRHWVVDADIKGYFDNIPHAQLMDRISDKISDSRVLGLIEKMLRQGVMETMNDWKPTEQGTPQGAVISTLLANIYLDPLDHQMDALRRDLIRYADDFDSHTPPQWTQPQNDHHASESSRARMGQLLPRRREHRIPEDRRLDTRANAQHPAGPPQAARQGARQRS